ncbi:MAG: hypothetical protein Q8R38_06030 [Candidatus Omnitrophota bacterium]|nr:hypothetical protein [Candidatus Omnitrophota bacterium]
MELIRNCSHDSSVQVAVDLDERAVPVGIVKTAFNADGARSIKREHDGLTWYGQRLNLACNPVLSFRAYKDTFFQLRLSYKDGIPGDLGLPITKNYRKIRNALSHYMDIFRIDDTNFSHGDYSIDNILFMDDGVAWVMDWENFNDKLPLEFDIIYCIIEACYFCYKRRGVFTVGDADAAIDLIKYGVGKLDMACGQILGSPAAYIRKLFMENRAVFGPQIMKYPMMNCPHGDIMAIDAFFGKRMKI